MKEIKSKSPAETERIAKELAHLLEAGDIVALTGELGTGKTFFINAVCKALGVEDIVASPTFTLMHIYSGQKAILHLDCYRLKSVLEAEMLGLDEYFNGGYICLIEWADKIKEILPDKTITVTLKQIANSKNSRIITISGL